MTDDHVEIVGRVKPANAEPPQAFLPSGRAPL